MLFAEVTLQTAQTAAHYGVGLGSVLAMICNWERERSMLSALIAGCLSWFYVLYFALTRKPEEASKRGFFPRSAARKV